MSNITPITAAQTGQSEADRLQASLDLINSKIADLAADVSAEALETEKVLLARAEHVRKALKDARRRERDDIDDIDPDDASAAIEEVKAQMRAWLAEYDAHFVAAQNHYALFNARTQTWEHITPAALPAYFPLLKERHAPTLFAEVMQEDGRNFLSETYSFRKVDPTVLNKLRFQFLQPQSGQHHWIFDTLIRSLCGGKQENIAHLERLILAKYHRPEQTNLPAVVFMDREGGTGKGLLGMVLAKVFGDGLVRANVPMSEVTGNFTSFITGSAVVMINEALAEKTDFDKLKAIIGSARIVSNAKFKAPYEVDNTPLYFISGNSGTRVVHITGTAQDRRWSVIRATLEFTSWLALDLETHMGLRMTSKEADLWARDNLDAILHDADEIAKWLGSLIARHGRVSTVAPLRGQDYQHVLENTRPPHERVFAKVFGEDFQSIKKSTLHAFYLHAATSENHTRTLGRTGFYDEAATWVRKNRPDVEEATVKVGGSTMTVFRVQGHQGGPDEDQYVIHDFTTKRPTWMIELD